MCWRGICGLCGGREWKQRYCEQRCRVCRKQRRSRHWRLRIGEHGQRPGICRSVRKLDAVERMCVWRTWRICICQLWQRCEWCRWHGVAEWRQLRWCGGDMWRCWRYWRPSDGRSWWLCNRRRICADRCGCCIWWCMWCWWCCVCHRRPGWRRWWSVRRQHRCVRREERCWCWWMYACGEWCCRR